MRACLFVCLSSLVSRLSSVVSQQRRDAQLRSALRALEGERQRVSEADRELRAALQRVDFEEAAAQASEKCCLAAELRAEDRKKSSS